MPSDPRTTAIGSDDAAAFANNGYVILDRVIELEPIIQTRCLVDRTFELGNRTPLDLFNNHYSPQRTNQGTFYDLCQRHPGFRALAESPIRRAVNTIGRKLASL